MDTLYFLVQNMMFFSIPLLIVALAAMFSERSGVINIGLEGIMVMGAFAGTLYLHFSGLETTNTLKNLVIAILISILAGTLYSALHAFASINMLADQTISGTAINLFSSAFAIFIARSLVGIQQIQFTGDYRFAKVAVLGDIPIIGPMFFQNAYITNYLGILILILSWFILYKTRFGLRLRSAGEFPQATDAAGISVKKIRWAGVLISGALGGLGGLAFIVPISTEFNGSVAGYGFLAIAVLIFGQWKPGLIALSAFFFGLLKTISSAYTSIPLLSDLGIPQVVYQVMPYLITIIVLFLTSKKSAAPAAEGQPFDKGKR
ncbi:MAG: ABC transporter permease [Tissierellia bacterium]|nr:ABC transporter permease [Tissierellia bacterium]